MNNTITVGIHQIPATTVADANLDFALHRIMQLVGSYWEQDDQWYIYNGSDDFLGSKAEMLERARVILAEEGIVSKPEHLPTIDVCFRELCPFCQLHTAETSGEHERDSSREVTRCQKCKAVRYGMGEWRKA